MASSVNELLMAPGWWKIDLRALPDEIFQNLAYFGEVYITTAKVGREFQTKASLKELARYTGILWERKREAETREIALSGPSNQAWLGANSGGDLFTTALNFDSQSFSTVVTAIIPDALTLGTIYTPGGAGLYNGRAAFMDTPEVALRRVCDLYDTEYVVYPNGTIDIGSPTDLGQVITPTVIAQPRSLADLEGLVDPNFEAIVPTNLSLYEDSREYATALLLTGQGAGETIILGSATSATTYKDPNGNTLDWKRLANEPILSIDNADDLAQAILDRLTIIKQVLTLGLDRFVVTGDYQIGDNLYVYSPPDIFDLDNIVRSFGQVINPRVIRIVGTTWPITAGMGVYYRDHTDAIYDLSPYMIYEKNKAASIKVGSFGPTPLDANLGNTVIIGRVADDDGIPAVADHTSVVETQSIYFDNEGGAHGWLSVQFDRVNLNTDGSAVQDGRHYKLRYGEKAAIDAGEDYETRTLDYDGADLTPEFSLYDLTPGTAYYYNIMLEDLPGNQSDPWNGGTDNEVSITADIIPPSKPAAPTVAGNPGTVMVVHTLGKDSGGTYNLESDIAKLKVYVDKTSSTFTIDDTPITGNLVGELTATAANVNGSIPAIGSFPVPDDGSSPDTERWVKVTAVDWSGNESTVRADGTTVTAELIADAWIDNLTATKIIAGDISVSLTFTVAGLAKSGNYVAGTSGWQIEADGDAEFNDVTIRGDVYGNWDGVEPANLATVDATATTGFAFDSSVGSAQLMGDLFLGGNFTMTTGGVWRTAGTGERFEFAQTDSNRLNLYTGDADEKAPGQLTFDDVGTTATVTLMTPAYQDAGGRSARTILLLEGGNAANTDFGDFDLYTDQTLAKKVRIFGDANATRGLLHFYAEGGDPYIRFSVGGTDRVEIQDQGINVLSAGSAAAPSLYFNSVTNKGFYDVSGSIGWSTGGTYRGEFGQGLVVGGVSDLGTGKVNVLNGVYLNATAYTNPDWVLELAATGVVKKYVDNLPADPILRLIPLDELEPHINKHHRLPGIVDEPTDIFERGDIALEWIERLVLYTLDQEKRITELETQLARRWHE